MLTYSPNSVLLVDEIYSIKTKFIPSPYVIFTYYANVQKPLPPPSSPLSPLDPLLIIALKDTVCTNRSRVARIFPRSSKEVFLSVFSFLEKLHFCREIENTGGWMRGGEEEKEEETKNEAEERVAARPV